MAKSFKNLPRPGESAAPKPASERDFFDLTDEPLIVLPPLISPQSVVSNKIGNTDGNTSNTNNTHNSSNIDSSSNKSNEPISSKALSDKEETVSNDVRQTFVLNRAHLEQLRDYVHARRAQGDYLYSQKQALQEALELLFANAAPAPPRPAQTREVEQQRRHRIQQGRRATK